MVRALFAALLLLGVARGEQQCEQGDEASLLSIKASNSLAESSGLRGTPCGRGAPCEDCQVCIWPGSSDSGPGHTGGCANPCADDKACPPWQKECSETCKSRVEAQIENRVGFEDAMKSVAEAYPACKCLGDPLKPCGEACGNSGQFCPPEQCIGNSFKSYVCAPPCAATDVKGQTCGERASSQAANNGGELFDAMTTVCQNYQECSCLCDAVPTPAPPGASLAQKNETEVYYCDPKLTDPPQFCRDGVKCVDLPGCTDTMDKCQCEPGASLVQKKGSRLGK